MHTDSHNYKNMTRKWEANDPNGTKVMSIAQFINLDFALVYFYFICKPPRVDTF